MLSTWFNGDLGQLLAPDPKVSSSSSSSSKKSTSLSTSTSTSRSFLGDLARMVAPDPHYYEDDAVNRTSGVDSPKAMSPLPASTATPTPASTSSPPLAPTPNLVPEPISVSTPSTKSSSSYSSSSLVMSTTEPSSRRTSFFTPPQQPQPQPQRKQRDDEEEQLRSQVLSAARGTAATLLSPTHQWERKHAVFSLCAKPTCKVSKLRKALAMVPPPQKKDAATATATATATEWQSSLATEELVYANAAQMAPIIPDGFTPCHAAAASGNVTALKVLLECCPAIRTSTDLQGRRPLHVAAEHQQREAVALLVQPEEIGPLAPVDLSGRTPLGWACASSVKPQKKKSTDNGNGDGDDHDDGDVETLLFSPGDRSVCPVTPREPRSGSSWGFAEIPGRRVTMEDAVCCSPPLFGVMDGHGDNGEASQWLADHLSKVYFDVVDTTDRNNQNQNEAVYAVERQQELWTSVCRQLEDGLARDLPQLSASGGGGSTGIFASVTSDHVVIANVGDCRAVLVWSCDGDDDDDVPEKGGGVRALSEDHKPCLPDERCRLEEAGFTVEGNQSNGGGQVVLTHPQTGTTTRLAMSRSFGDFDFKQQSQLQPQKQGVICVPDVTVHHRNHDRDLCLVLACDGVWDVMSNEEVGTFVRDQWREWSAMSSSSSSRDPDDTCPKDTTRRIPTPILYGTRLSAIGDALLQECLTRGSHDNMSVVLVDLTTTPTHTAIHTDDDDVDVDVDPLATTVGTKLTFD